jgi:hypothetical protein
MAVAGGWEAAYSAALLSLFEVRSCVHSPAGRRICDSGAPSATFGNSAKSALM